MINPDYKIALPLQPILILLAKSMAIGLIASIPLGPVGILCIQRTLSRGVLSGFLTGMGAAAADAFFAVVAVFGLSFIINFIESQQFLMRTAGGALLIMIGLRIFLSNPVRVLRADRNNQQGRLSDFFSVLLLMLTNPLAIFLFLAAFASLELVSPNPGPLVAFTIVTGILAGASLYWLLLSSFINIFRNRFRIRMLFRITRSAGALIILSGIASLLSIII